MLKVALAKAILNCTHRSVPHIHSLNHQNEVLNRFHAMVVHGIHGYIGGRQQNSGKSAIS